MQLKTTLTPWTASLRASDLDVARRQEAMSAEKAALFDLLDLTSSKPQLHATSRRRPAQWQCCVDVHGRWREVVGQEAAPHALPSSGLS
mmetsp:Transcript_33381/g.72986  ORF Transcript_33381/g.72986 Transcript_33381/m.72986 type:complete len:89 (-) Transcript_33381:1289-1555(-)